jgi:hypothetical protein
MPGIISKLINPTLQYIEAAVTGDDVLECRIHALKAVHPQRKIRLGILRIKWLRTLNQVTVPTSAGTWLGLPILAGSA